MNVFLQPFVSQMNRLANDGVTVSMPPESHKIFVYAICSCVDSVARAPMQGRGGCVKYILMEDVIPNRNHQDTLQHMQQSVESGQSVYGVLKQSALVHLTNFNIITGFVPDPMLCINLGIAKQFAKYWFDTSGKLYSLSNQETKLIDDILKDIKVPISERNCWKAREYENWAYYILLQDNISIEQIYEADHLLKTFIALTEYYYTKSAMTSNVHQLMHLTQSVINWGPLWSHSGYGFENGNGKIVQQVQAAKGVVHQICRNIGMSRSAMILKKFLNETDPDSLILDYAKHLENRESLKTHKTEVCRYFGKTKRPRISWIRELELSDSASAYQKMIKNDCLYLSCNIFQNDNLIDFHIKKIISIDDTLYAVDTHDIDKICLHVELQNKMYITPLPYLDSY
ncbi:hypothetical protein TKK_0015346 [Trichogramma kaykai]